MLRRTAVHPLAHKPGVFILCVASTALLTNSAAADRQSAAAHHCGAGHRFVWLTLRRRRRRLWTGGHFDRTSTEPQPKARPNALPSRLPLLRTSHLMKHLKALFRGFHACCLSADPFFRRFCSFFLSAALQSARSYYTSIVVVQCCQSLRTLSVLLCALILSFCFRVVSVCHVRERSVSKSIAR